VTGGARLLRLVVKAGVDVSGGVSSGTAYSLESACPACGTGAAQVGPLRLPRFDAPRAEIFSTLDDEVLVAPPLAARLREAGVRSLGPVIGASSDAPLPFEQLLPEGVLPRFSPETTGVVRERPCPVCDRDGHFGVPRVPLQLAYAALPTALLERHVLATFERFGNSRLRTPLRDSVFAAPVYVVSSRVADVLRTAGARAAGFEPVRLEPEAHTAAAEAGTARAGAAR
jgi:hypothetical protein